MNKQSYQIDINASADKVYKTMLGLENKSTYEQWSKLFNPTSTYKGSWGKGSKMHFMGTAENGKQGGVASEILENIPNQLISMKHYAVLDEGKEISEGSEIEQWLGGIESYAFEENKGITTVKVTTDTPEDFKNYFDESWPKALSKLKEICER